MATSQVEDTNTQSQKLYTCEHCQMTFLRPVHLERHMRSNHSREQESECKVCHKLFQNKYYLSVHMLTHAMDKELECPLCKKRFQDQDTLNKHKDAHLGIAMNNRMNPQLNNQIGARNLVNPAASTAALVPTSSANRGNTLSCDLRNNNLNTLNQGAQNYRAGQAAAAAQNAMRMAQNKNSTISCDLRAGDINTLNQNPTSPIRLPQKRPGSDDVIVTGIGSLKRPFRNQPPSGAIASGNQAPVYGSRFAAPNRTPTNPPPGNSFLKSQLRAHNSMASQRSPVGNTMTNRNITDRIYLTSEGGVSSQSTVRNSLPARISYNNRKQLVNRYGNNFISPNLGNQQNQLMRNNNQPNQRGDRGVVNCDLTRINLGNVNQNSGSPYNNASQQFSNGTKETDGTVNCDLSITNIGSLNNNPWPTNSHSNSHSTPVRNYEQTTRPASTVNFDLSASDINVLNRSQRIQQVGRMVGPGTHTVGQGSGTLNCDLSRSNLSSMERNRHALNNGNRFGRLNPNMITSQNSQQQAQGTVSCDLSSKNLTDLNRRNTICYRANNQAALGQNRQPSGTVNCNLANVNLGSLNQRVANNMARGQSNQQQVRPVQVYANSAALQRQKNAAALSNSNFGVRGPNNVLRGGTLAGRPLGVGQSPSTLSNMNRSRMARLFRQRKTLAANNANVAVIDLDPDDNVSVGPKTPNRPTNSIVQFDLTGPDVNVTTIENGKSSSGALVDVVELGTNKSSSTQRGANNSGPVVEFDLSGTSIQTFSSGETESANTCTINLNGDNWTSNSRNNNTSSDITFSNVRSVSSLQSATSEAERTSGITLVDIRSLSGSEIGGKKSQSAPNNSSSLPPADSQSSENLPDPRVVMDTADISSSIENAQASVVTDSASASAAEDNVELKEDYFTCKTCHEQIHHLCNYICHLKSHNSTKFCICYYCDSVFANIQELVVHSVVHVGDLKKQCVFCREALAAGEDPITHMTGCGEFQCIMFESGTRVKIEKESAEKADNVAKDKGAEIVPQNEADPNKEAEKVAESEASPKDGISVEKGENEMTKDEGTSDEKVSEKANEEAESLDTKVESPDKKPEGPSSAEAEKSAEKESGVDNGEKETSKMEEDHQNNNNNDNNQSVNEKKGKRGGKKKKKKAGKKRKKEEDSEDSDMDEWEPDGSTNGENASDLNESEEEEEEEEEKNEESGSKKKNDSPWCEWEKNVVKRSKRGKSVATGESETKTTDKPQEEADSNRRVLRSRRH